jgi:hypothetical protein
MNVSGICFIILIGAAVLVSGVSAQTVDNNAGYTVTPAGDLQLPRMFMPMSAATITQGETDWYSYYVSSGTSSITTDLDWGDTSDSLSLTIIAPDGTLGPYYDSADGVTDGEIALLISRSGGLAPGTWNFRVYGNQVTGSQSYNFFVY